MCYMLDRCEQKVCGVILPKDRGPRFVTIRRGGTLTDSDHQLLALWAASCAEHVLDLFESARPEDPRPRHAIEQARAWVRGEITMSQARTAAGHANAAARDLSGAARTPRRGRPGRGRRTRRRDELGAAAYAIRPHVLPRRKEKAAARGDLSACGARRAPGGDSRARPRRSAVGNENCWSVFDAEKRVRLAPALPQQTPVCPTEVMRSAEG